MGIATADDGMRPIRKSSRAVDMLVFPPFANAVRDGATPNGPGRP
jgi:hypothetical protein